MSIADKFEVEAVEDEDGEMSAPIKPDPVVVWSSKEASWLLWLLFLSNVNA